MKYLLTLIAFIICFTASAQRCKDTMYLLPYTDIQTTTVSDTFKLSRTEIVPISPTTVCIKEPKRLSKKFCNTVIYYDSIATTVYYTSTTKYDTLVTQICKPIKYGMQIAIDCPSIINPTFQQQMQYRDSILKQEGVKIVRENISILNMSTARMDWLVAHGYKLALNISYMQQGLPNSIFCPADSLDSYKKSVEYIIKRYLPALEFIVIENEEMNDSYRNYTITSMNDYYAELRTAVGLAKTYGVKITNGGLETRTVRTMTYRWLATFDSARANFFFLQCIPYADWNMVLKKNNANLEAKVRDAETSLDVYSILDYINVHLYSPIGKRGTTWSVYDATDTVAYGLKDIVDYLQQRTGKNIISNEIGTLYYNGRLIQSIISNLDLEYQVFWDGYGGEFGAKPFNDCYILNENGKAFRNSIKK